MRFALTFAACVFSAASADYNWNLPKGFPKPLVPADNPMTVEKVKLGRYLFYDSKLSSNGKSSCATCHKQELAFTDGQPVSVGTTGEKHPRNSMSLVNAAYNATHTWSNPKTKQFEEQALVPMFGEHPVELGIGPGDRLPNALRLNSVYRDLFPQAFPGKIDPFTVSNATKAIASFERTIVSASSSWDRYHYGGDDAAISESAKRGEILFFSQKLSCFRCHGGFNFSGPTVSQNHAEAEVEFHNTGLYSRYPSPNEGLAEFTKDPKDSGKFKAPTLRNIAVTAPYMHDGSLATLEEVLDHYAAGGRDGGNHPNKNPLIGGFEMSNQNQKDLVEFLNSLTDNSVLHDPRFSNPW